MGNITTINRRNDFNRAYKKGKNFVSSSIILYVSKNYKKGIRLGITTSKKVGNAVYRNRARRVIKESFRQILPSLSGNFDIVIVARSKTPYLKTQDVKIKMISFLKEAGILK